MQTLSIGQLASQAGVGVETVRFYERHGLLPEPPRSQAGYRQYAPEAVRRLRFIRRAKDLGFTLREIHELLALRASECGCATMRAQAVTKVRDIERRIAQLERMRDALSELAQACGGEGSLDACPILAALDDPQDHDNEEDRRAD